jgi:hypothetical protein
MVSAIAFLVAILVVVVGVLLGLAATKPNTFRVRRATRIEAPPEQIFAFVNDLRSFVAWSPYEKKDPAMKRSFSGAVTGKGAIYAFDGNNQIGAGRLEITDSARPSKVTMNLDFFRPFKAHNIVAFTLEPQGDATEVTWDLHGPVPFMAKIMHVICNMDRMIGRDFETGLANLKALAEGHAADTEMSPA